MRGAATTSIWSNSAPVATPAAAAASIRAAAAPEATLAATRALRKEEKDADAV